MLNKKFEMTRSYVDLMITCTYYAPDNRRVPSDINVLVPRQKFLELYDSGRLEYQIEGTNPPEHYPDPEKLRSQLHNEGRVLKKPPKQ